MIIYKLTNGMAHDIKYSRTLEDGYIKACDGDRIPDEYDRIKSEDGTIELDSDDYKKSVRKDNQRCEIIRLSNAARYHFDKVSRWPDTEGKWEAWLAELFVIYDSDDIQELPPKPY